VDRIVGPASSPDGHPSYDRAEAVDEYGRQYTIYNIPAEGESGIFWTQVDVEVETVPASEIWRVVS
jgi:hypothetical protein